MWTRIDSSMGENVEIVGTHASMRRVKSELGITGRRCIRVAACGAYRTYRMVGTTYQFTVTHCE